MIDATLGTIISVVVGYLLGSVPSGLLIGRRLAGVDIRQAGSGRTGATNAMRLLGARGFVLTFAADAGKAVLAVLVARWLVGDRFGPSVAECAAALAAIVGHNWSVYIKLGGGRGVACSFGAMLALNPLSALIGVLTGGILIRATRYVSLGSIVGTIVGLFATLASVLIGTSPPPLAGFAIGAALLVIASHRDNIQRLLAGTERRIGEPLRPV